MWEWFWDCPWQEFSIGIVSEIVTVAFRKLYDSNFWYRLLLFCVSCYLMSRSQGYQKTCFGGKSYLMLKLCIGVSYMDSIMHKVLVLSMCIFAWSKKNQKKIRDNIFSECLKLKVVFSDITESHISVTRIMKFKLCMNVLCLDRWPWTELHLSMDAIMNRIQMK